MSSQWSRHTWLDTWTETSSQMVESMVAANRATMAAFGVDPPGDGSNPETGTDMEVEVDDSHVVTPIEATEELPEWEVETTADTREELGVGDRFSFTKTLSDEDVHRFARASGDTNPLHLDDEYASRTRFGGRIVHGTLVGGLISAALARMPGLVVYLSQDLEFQNPVQIGERLTADCEVVEDLGHNQYRLTTVVHKDETTIIDGEATVLIDEVPE